MSNTVYILFERFRDGEDQFVDLFWDRSTPDKIAAEYPAGLMDGYWVQEWEIK